MKFSDYNFKPSDVIEGLNTFYKKDEENKNGDHPPFGWRMGYSKYACRFFNIKTRDGKSYETFENECLEEAITWLREECDIFYTPGMKWEDLKYKIPDKAAEKEFGTTDIREMYPCCILMRPRACGKKLWISSNPSFRDDAFHRMVEAERAARKYSLKEFERDDAEKVMNYCMNDVICSEALMREKERIDGKEALEALRDIYMELDCPGEASFRRWHDLDIDDVSIEHMKDYIKGKAKFYKDLSEKTGEDNQTLRNLINQIHEESDI